MCRTVKPHVGFTVRHSLLFITLIYEHNKNFIRNRYGTDIIGRRRRRTG